MKHKLFLGALALLATATLAFTSCSDDDIPGNEANVTFSDIEIGAENSKEALVGDEMHVEASIVSGAKIKQIEVKLTPKQGVGGNGTSYQFTDAKYTNVLNTTFHEHIDIPKELPAGAYVLALVVTDVNGAQKSFETEVMLKAVDPKAPVVELTSPNDGNKTGVAGANIVFKGKITVTSPIEEIEIEFHGAKEYPIEIDDYKGRTGTFEFEKTVTIPAEAAAGSYHVHFTVEDADGRSTTAEVEDFTVTAK